MKICSMLLYGCKIWGTKQFETIERIQYYASKRFMNVSQKASNSDRYVRKFYDMLLHFDTLGYKIWASEVRNFLSVNGFMYVWEDSGSSK